MKKTFAIIHTLKSCTVLKCAFINANDSDTAEKTLVARLGGDNAVDITWIVETDNEQVAFDTYHEESAVEGVPT